MDERDRLLIRLETIITEQALPWVKDLDRRVDKLEKAGTFRSGADSARSSVWANSKWVVGVIVTIAGICGGIVSAAIGALFGGS